MKCHVIAVVCLMLVCSSVMANPTDKTAGTDATAVVTSDSGAVATSTIAATAVDKKSVLKGATLPSASPATNNTQLPQPPDVTSSLLQVTLGLFLVLLIIAAAAWFARRFGKFTVSGKGSLRIIGGLHMGARERVVLMQVGDQQLLVGVAPGSIRTLLVLDQPVVTDERAVSATQSPANAFSAILGKFQSS